MSKIELKNNGVVLTFEIIKRHGLIKVTKRSFFRTISIDFYSTKTILPVFSFVDEDSNFASSKLKKLIKCFVIILILCWLIYNLFFICKLGFTCELILGIIMQSVFLVFMAPSRCKKKYVFQSYVGDNLEICFCEKNSCKAKKIAKLISRISLKKFVMPPLKREDTIPVFDNKSDEYL